MPRFIGTQPAADEIATIRRDVAAIAKRHGGSRVVRVRKLSGSMSYRVMVAADREFTAKVGPAFRLEVISYLKGRGLDIGPVDGDVYSLANETRLSNEHGHASVELCVSRWTAA